MRRNFSFAIVFAFFAVLSGCSPPDGRAHPGTESPTLTHNDFHHNGIGVKALQASNYVRDTLARSVLNQATLDGLNVPGASYHEETKELLKYIVSCALNDSRSLRLDGAELRGQLALCDDWFSEQPSEDCLQIVSSCVLARVNAAGKRVIISVRGDGVRLQTEVGVEREFRGRMDPVTMTHVSEPIKSFAPSCSDALQTNSTRNCGWAPLYVGRCAAGATVTINAVSTDILLRVCKGLYGCDNPTGVPAPASDPPAYAGLLGDSNNGKLDFTCPVNGPLVIGEEDWTPSTPLDAPRYGYFSVMIADLDPKEPADPLREIPVKASSSTYLEYPATEEHVFTYRVGAFYGNIFSYSNVNSKPLLGGADTNTDMNACYGRGWSCGLAHLTDRFCAGAGSAVAPTACDATNIDKYCFNAPPEACMDGVDDRCKLDRGLPGDYYRDCASPGGATRWLHPITAYLNHPCDVSPDGQCGYSEVGDHQNAHIPPQ